MNEQIVLAFRNLGLTEYQARAMAALYNNGSMIGTRLAQFAEVPVTKIYSILDQLEKLGFVYYSPQRPKKYHAAAPDEVIEFIMEKRREEMKQLREYSKQIQTILKNSFKGASSSDSDKVLFYPTNESVWNSGIVGIFNDSKREVLAFGFKEAWEDALRHSALWHAGLKAAGRGVLIKTFFPKSLFNDISKLLPLAVDDCIKFVSHKNDFNRLVPDSQVIYAGMVADDAILGFAFQDPETKLVVNGIRINDANVARGFSEYYFKPIWNQTQNTEGFVREIARQELKRRSIQT
ncbi:MAG: TrmB family transcriptional regulator [Candidatus Aenigmarchaeota archaeon]|nr:TrmB family transcriptional regulator [Candidatus Aenigmarchaeota archaeon]